MDRTLSFSVVLTVISLALVFFFPTGALSQDSTCQVLLLGLKPCLPYVGAGNTTNPDSACCTPLGTLLTTQPTCLCQIGSLAQLSNTTINGTRALDVAAACSNSSVPASVSSCLLATAPSGSTSTPPPTSGSSSASNGNAGITVSPSSFVGGVVIAMISALLSL